MKRIADLLLAVIGAGALWPLALVLWAAIAATSPGAALLRQPRAGRGGRSFPLLKFRTMMPGREAVTPVGRWLRETALDELPQLLNILRGELSFVGPRPLVAHEAAAVAGMPGGDLRATVTPGLAGLAQLYGGKHPDPSARLALDLAYVRHGGWWWDVRIVCGAVMTSVRRAWEPRA